MGHVMFTKINPIAFEFGPFAIHWYALTMVGGVVLAVLLAMKEGPRKKITSDNVLDLALWGFPIGIIGARLYYVIFEWSYYKDHLSEIFAVWNGGLAIYGGLIAGLLTLIVYSYYQLIDPWDFLDVVTPGIMLAQALGRWGNFINQEAYGKAVDNLNYLPKFIRDQMYIDGAYRQPTFLYESAWNLVGFILILILRRIPRLLQKGEVLAFYMIWYGIGRLIIEGMRTDSLMFLGMRVSQLVSIVMILAGVSIFMINRVRARHIYYQNA
jgi:phosphatidylglycerol:prolipoprotein diacylglycerol transferase